MTSLLGFLLSATVVVGAGVVLARAGDVIAARTRLGSVWVVGWIAIYSASRTT